MGYYRNYYGARTMPDEPYTVEEISMVDMVNSPPHYNDGKVECIEAIEAAMSGQAFEGYLKGNVLKYIWRYEKKGGTQDLEKAKWYLTKLSEVANVNEFFSTTKENKPGM